MNFQRSRSSRKSATQYAFEVRPRTWLSPLKRSYTSVEECFVLFLRVLTRDGANPGRERTISGMRGDAAATATAAAAEVVIDSYVSE